MEINYCDLCNAPVKVEEIIMCYTCRPGYNPPNPNKYESQEEYNKDMEYWIQNLVKETKEICPTCDMILKGIFQLRMQNISKLPKDLLGWYELPTIKEPVYNGKLLKVKLTPKDIDELIQSKKLTKRYFANIIELEMK